MYDLDDVLKPECDVHQDLAELWNLITPEEQHLIKLRMDDLFKNGVPFELKHEKIIYINVFLALAQVDLIACQIPLKFESKISTPEFAQRLRAQLLDEIFHVMLSLKIVYMLSSPQLPPQEINDSTKKLREFIKKEKCPQIAIIFLNLISEGIAEELVKCFHQCGFALKVFEIIIKDERRHVSDADLFFTMGVPDKKILQQKLSEFEEFILSSQIFQLNRSMALITILGIDGMQNFIKMVNHKYKEQLQKLKLKPGAKWASVIHYFDKFLNNIQNNKTVSQEIKKTPLRKLGMTQWGNPADPTMVGQFNIDVTCLDVFEKKYPSTTLTTLMLQTLSQLLIDHPQYSLFLNDQKLFQRTKANVCLVVKLPNCGDHLGIITFQDCHQMLTSDLSARIRQIVSMMVSCFKKREQLEIEYPMLTQIEDNIINEMSDKVFHPLRLTIPGMSLSNIGPYGFTQSVSPLFSNEAAKVTLMTVKKTPVWCNKTKTFIGRDLLPVSVSCDHRIFGGNMPLPKIMDRTFQNVFAKMQSDISKGSSKIVKSANLLNANLKNKLLMKMIDSLLSENLQFGYMALMTLQTMWPDYLGIEEIFGLNPMDSIQETTA